MHVSGDVNVLHNAHVPTRALRHGADPASPPPNTVQRDSGQKGAFLADLPALWPQMDTRVLRYHVLPPLLQVGSTVVGSPAMHWQ